MKNTASYDSFRAKRSSIVGAIKAVHSTLEQVELPHKAMHSMSEQAELLRKAVHSTAEQVDPLHKAVYSTAEQVEQLKLCNDS